MAKSLKIDFINPKSNDISSNIKFFGKNYLSPMLGIQVLATITPKHIPVRVIDEVVEPIDYDTDANVIGISILTANALKGYEIADRFRELGKTVLIGGLHATYQNLEAKKHADSVILGEAEEIWPQILEDLEQGNLKPFYKQKKVTDLEKLPIPDRKFLDLDKYLFEFMQTSRGCPYSCEFCAEKDYKGAFYRFRRTDDVVREMEAGNKKFWLWGDVDAFCHYERYGSLFKKMPKLGIWWGASVSAKKCKDEDFLKLAYDSGCRMVFVGFESISKKSLKSIKKGWNKPEEYASIVEKLHRNGIITYGLFMFGFDDDDDSVFEETLNFINNAKIPLANFSIMTPFPGTALFQRLRQENRMITYNWDLYSNVFPVYKPKLMSAKTLKDGSIWAFKKFYSKKNILKRMLTKHKELSSTLLFFNNWGLRKATITIDNYPFYEALGKTEEEMGKEMFGVKAQETIV